MTSSEGIRIEQVLLVYKKSKLDLYVHTKKNRRYTELIERSAPVTRSFAAAHEAHVATLESVKRDLRSAGVSFRTCYRGRLKQAATAGRLVVTVGGDGTLLDASHKVDNTGATLMGVNSDPARSVGFLCAADRETFAARLGEALEGSRLPVAVARIEGSVDGEPLPIPVLNEVLVAHKNPAATTRYHLHPRPRARGISVEPADDDVERHKSSGVWIAAPAGSTAAIFSAGGEVQPLDDARLQMRVRELYAVASDKPPTAAGWIEPGASIRFVSQMREGALYLDGPHVRVPFPVGATFEVSGAAPPLSLIVSDEMEQRRGALVANRAQLQRPGHDT